MNKILKEESRKIIKTNVKIGETIQELEGTDSSSGSSAHLDIFFFAQIFSSFAGLF